MAVKLRPDPNGMSQGTYTGNVSFSRGNVDLIANPAKMSSGFVPNTPPPTAPPPTTKPAPPPTPRFNEVGAFMTGSSQ